MKIPTGKWNHEATINGVKMKTRRNDDPSEGRWNAFIKPLLPFEKGEERRITDLGCNAGFYMRQFADLGYNAIGIERDTMFLEHARYWEKNDPKGIKIIEGDLNEFDIPVSSIVVLAQVHYWLTPEQLKKIVKKLKDRAQYVTVIGRHRRVDGSVVEGDTVLQNLKSPSGADQLKLTFGEWNVLKTVYGEGKNFRHFSMLFKNPAIEERDIDELELYPPNMKYKGFLPAFNKVIDSVLAGKKVDSVDYLEYLTKRKFADRDEVLKKHIKLIKDMVENGIGEPFTVGRIMKDEYNKNGIWDGDHRYAVARKISIKKLLTKVFSEDQAKQNEKDRWQEGWSENEREKVWI